MYIDPKSGITISSNGSAAVESFMSTFQAVVKASEDLKQAQTAYIYKKYGFVYIIPLDGWVTKCKQKGHTSFEGILNHYQKADPKRGELIFVGDLGDEYNQKFVVYKITKVEKIDRFFDFPPVVYGEEVGEFSTKGVL